MFKAIEVPREEELGQFSRLLWQQKIPHRIFDVDDGRILAVPKEADVSKVFRLYEQWRLGEVAPSEQDAVGFSGFFDANDFIARVTAACTRTPLTIFVVLACIMLAFVSGLGTDRSVVSMFLYPDFSFGGRTIFLEQVLENFTFTHFLKMIAPILMHAGLIHLAFNMLWFWEFGKRIEAVQSSLTMLVMIIVVALISNTTQYLYGGGNNFVGMSGVVYGMLGYIWMWQLFDPAKNLRLPPALIFIMLILLVALTAIDLGFIANYGHIGGLLSGVVYGAAAATVSRIHRSLKVSR